MKYEFGVAKKYHFSGAGVEDLESERFSTYEEAFAYASEEDECVPTIYIIVDEKYAFLCKPYAKGCILSPSDVVPWVYSIESKPWGQIETRIWWEELKKNPSAFYHLAVGKIEG